MTVRTLVKTISDIMRQDTGVDGDAQRISQLCWMFFLKIIDDQDLELELLDESYRSPIPKEFQWRAWAADPEGRTGEALLAFVNGELFPGLKGLSVSGKPGDRRMVVKGVFADAYNYMKSGQLIRQVLNKINEVDFNNLVERQHFGDIYEQILNDLQSAGNAGEYYTPRAVTTFMTERIDPRPGEVLFDPACGTGGFLTSAIHYMRDKHVKRPEHERKMQAGLRAVEKKPLPHMLCVTNILLHGIEDASFVRHDNTLARPYTSYTQSDRVDIVLTNPPFGGREEDGIESNFPSHFRTKETADLFLALIVRLLKKNGRAAVVLPDGSLFGEGVKTRLKEHLMQECNLHTIVRLPNSVFKPYASIGTNLLFFEKGEPTKDIWYWEHQVPAGQKGYSMTKPIRVEHFQSCVDWWGGPAREGRVAGPHAWKVTAEEIQSRGFNLDVKNPHTIADEHGDPEVLLARLDATDAQTAELRGHLKAILTESACEERAWLLLKQFERLAGTPEAVARLRQFILSQAIRGRLMAQDAKDEPASRLLARVAGTPPRMSANTDGGGATGSGSVVMDTLNFPLPAGWEWTTLSAVAKVVMGQSPPGASYNKHGDGVPLINGPVEFSSGPFGRTVVNQYTSQPTNFCESGDFLLCVRGSTTGRTNVASTRACIGRGVAAIQGRFPDEYLRLYLWHRREALIGLGRGIAFPSISRKQIETLRVPLPPLAEQQRIVTRVKQLMSLCSELERGLADGANQRIRILDSLVAADT